MTSNYNPVSLSPQKLNGQVTGLDNHLCLNMIICRPDKDICFHSARKCQARGQWQVHTPRCQRNLMMPVPSRKRRVQTRGPAQGRRLASRQHLRRTSTSARPDWSRDKLIGPGDRDRRNPVFTSPGLHDTVVPSKTSFPRLVHVDIREKKLYRSENFRYAEFAVNNF